MQLTSNQKTLLKSHLTANTNTIINVANGQPTAINTLISAPFNGENLQRIADWYAGLAVAGDNQAFTTRNLWNPKTTIKLLNAAVRWQDLIPHDLGGSPTVDQQFLSRCEKWLRWQSMIWNQNEGIDMTDAQVRAGVLAIFGDTVGPSTADSIGKVGCGKLDARRVEMVMAGSVVGAATNAWTGSRVCPPNVLGVTLSEADLEDTLLNG